MRQQFYRFAHQRLAAEVHKDPQGWWRRLSSEGAAPLERVWNEAGQGLGAADKGNFAGFEVRPISSVPGVDAIAVMMPAPKAPAECHAVALARKAGSTGPIRYFVLEKGSDDGGGAPRAFWAEWRSAPGGVTMRVRGQDVSPITVEAMLADIASELEIDVSGGPDWSVLGGAPPGPPPPRASGGKGGKIFKVGCAALTLMMVALCGFGGYLAWLEEGRSWNEPGDEVRPPPSSRASPSSSSSSGTAPTTPSTSSGSRSTARRWTASSWPPARSAAPAAAIPRSATSPRA